jgi:hypothetical protein
LAQVTDLRQQEGYKIFLTRIDASDCVEQLRENGMSDLKAKQIINNRLNKYLTDIKQGLKNGTVKLN